MTLPKAFTGFTKCKIVAINPSEEEIEQLTGEYPEDFKPYSWERSDILHGRIDIYLQDISDEVYKYSIYISDEALEYKSGIKKYINCVGDTQPANTEDDLWDSFKYFENATWIDGKPTNKEIIGDKEYHIARKGEEEVLHLRKLLINGNLKDPKANIFLNWEKLLSGDVSRLQKDISNTGEYHLVCLLYVDEELHQKVWKEFLPVKMLAEINTQSFSKYTIGVWNKYKKNLENEYSGIKGHYYLGRLKKFEESDFKNVKELNPNLWEY